MMHFSSLAAVASLYAGYQADEALIDLYVRPRAQDKQALIGAARLARDDRIAALESMGLDSASCDPNLSWGTPLVKWDPHSPPRAVTFVSSSGDSASILCKKSKKYPQFFGKNLFNGKLFGAQPMPPRRDPRPPRPPPEPPS